MEQRGQISRITDARPVRPNRIMDTLRDTGLVVEGRFHDVSQVTISSKGVTREYPVRAYTVVSNPGKPEELVETVFNPSPRNLREILAFS